MNWNFLLTFLKLCETKSFHKTAESLHMTQPGVSQHLKQLENYFNRPLVFRKHKVFELTGEGEKLYHYGKKLIADHQIFLQQLHEASPFQGECKIAAPGSFGLELYDRVLALCERHRDLTIHFQVAPNRTILQALRTEELDLGFVTEIDYEAELHFKCIAQERLYLLIPKKRNKKITFDDLSELGFIAHPDGYHHASRVLANAFPHDFKGMDKIKQRGFVNQIHRIHEPVARGLGFSSLPETAAKKFHNPQKITLWPPTSEIIDQVYLVYRRYRVLPSHVQYILNDLIGTPI